MLPDGGHFAQVYARNVGADKQTAESLFKYFTTGTTT
jgi:hypothetical protein